MSQIKMEPIIQVVGIIDEKEARILVDAGVKYLGFPLRLDVNKADITEENAAQIIRNLRPPVSGVLVTYLSNAGEVIDLCAELGVKRVQLHGDITVKELSRLRNLKADHFIMKSLIIRGDNLQDLKIQVEKFSPYVDVFITDTFDAETGASGATGKIHDWNIDRKLVEISTKPVILAGGLRPSNVEEAIRTVRPAGVDVHTGVEGKNGRKDPTLVKQFVKNAIHAFKSIPPLDFE